ncbi:MAG: hypothetical protein ACE5FT_05945 [Candidatus Nanoarchaeia archaeon]
MPQVNETSWIFNSRAPSGPIEVNGIYGNATIDQTDLLEHMFAMDIPQRLTVEGYNNQWQIEPAIPTSDNGGLQRLARMAGTLSGRSVITFHEGGRGKGSYESSLEDHNLFNEMNLIGEVANYVFPPHIGEQRDSMLAHIYGHMMDPTPIHFTDETELRVLEAMIQDSLIEITKERNH